MKASLSVVAAAVVLVLASLIVLAGEAIQFSGALQILRGAGRSLSAFINARVALLFALPVTFSRLSLVAALGLLRSREWGRRITLFLATVPVTVYSLVVTFKPVSIFPARMHAAPFAMGDLGLPVCVYALVVFIALSLWWLILLLRKEIRSQFQ